MNKFLLVTYASKYGATREIAEKIGELLRQAGWQANVVPVKDLRSLDNYAAVILGSAVYIGKWQKEAIEFLQNNEKILAQLPVWLFSSGPTGDGDPVKLLDGWRLPVNIQPVVDRIQPQDIVVFHGNINPQKLNFIERQVVKSLKKPFGDYRDWEAIKTWTSNINDALRGSRPLPVGEEAILAGKYSDGFVS